MDRWDLAQPRCTLGTPVDLTYSTTNEKPPVSPPPPLATPANQHINPTLTLYDDTLTDRISAD